MYQDIINAITSVGFPIVACCAMGWYVYTSNKRMDARMDSILDQHREETQELTKTINNNTVALTKLCDKIEYSK